MDSNDGFCNRRARLLKRYRQFLVLELKAVERELAVLGADGVAESDCPFMAKVATASPRNAQVVRMLRAAGSHAAMH